MRNSLDRFRHIDILRWAFLAAMPAVLAAMPSPLVAGEASRNLAVNPDFARTYAGRRSPEPYPKNMPGLDKDAAMPYAWTVQPNRSSGGGGDTIGAISPASVDGRAALRVTNLLLVMVDQPDIFRRRDGILW